ncbi:MAG: triosephosphate isomerase [uncultured bacterium]|nr:MAG: triosephosphate isomerase [uncultured bacterium]
MKFVIGNLKMNISSAQERDRYFESFKKEVKNIKTEPDTQIVLCVPSLFLETFSKKIKSKGISIGVQNIFWEEKGSFTGETSPLSAANLGAQYAIIGHSERRRYFNETSEQANLKIKAALKNKLTPVYCVGETKEEREEGTAAESIISQIRRGMEELTPGQAEKVIIAYEPVWAVGSDLVPTSDEILEVKILLKKILVEKYGLAVAEKVSILYGGSVKAESINQLCLEPGLDGVLVGRESLMPRDFLKIVSVMESDNKK